jgi:LysM repeat protein
MPGAPYDNGYLQPVKLPSETYHIVRGGETLRSIAEQYRIPFIDLARWNGIGSPYNIYPGKRLTLVP